MEQVGFWFEGANMVYCESVSKQSRQDISNPLAYIWNAMKEL